MVRHVTRRIIPPQNPRHIQDMPGVLRKSAMANTFRPANGMNNSISTLDFDALRQMKCF